MDGIIIIAKPEGFTSFDVVAKMRGMLHTKKVGHAGTLDPMATGVLPVFVGRGTKCCDILPCQDKEYRAVFRLGITTDTQDITGKVLEQRPVTADRAQVEQVISEFVGEIEQVPPMYSAVQINGQRLYDLARQGIEVERPARKITIYRCDLLGEGPNPNEYSIDVACSKGTYIRTLCADIGEKLGCGAAMTSLCRTQAAGFTLEEALPLEEAQRLASLGQLEEHIRSVEEVFRSLPCVHLSEAQTRMYKNGVRLDLKRVEWDETMDSDLRVLGFDGRFLGVGYADQEAGELRSRQLFDISH